MNRSLATALVAILLMASSAAGLTIAFTDIGMTPMTAAQLNAFTQGAQIWQSAFTDPVTVNINIAFDAPSSFPRPSILGSTLAARTTSSYGFYQVFGVNDASTTEESTAFMLLPSIQLDRVTDINGSRAAMSITLSTANAKALGLGTGLDPDYGVALRNNADANIRFNNNFAATFDYDRSNGIGPGLTDFVTVAAHEIGHALGFFSVADIQDFNPSVTFHPSPLDVWRFAETGGAHDVLNETRWITAGPAEYYDMVLNNVSFSQGVSVTTDANCSAGSGSCQASHWRDNLPYLMKASLARGVSLNPREEDLHALDYIGWNRPGSILHRLGIRPLLVRVGWYPLGPIVPTFGGAFDDFSAPPDENDIPKVDFQPNVAIRLGIDLGVPGQTMRSGLGLARFEDAMQNPNAIVVKPVDHDDPGHLIEETRMPMTLIPPRITDFVFVSDDDKTQFVFTGVFAESGAMFDPMLGNFGGYRITGIIDGYGDNKIGDVDGQMTFLLLADNPSGVPSPANLSIFNLVVAEDNMLFLDDLSAFGIAHPSGDYNQNGVVDAPDYVLWRKTLGQAGANLVADGNGDGKIDDGDYDIWRANFGKSIALGATGSGSGAVPEPATLSLTLLAACGLLLLGRGAVRPTRQ